MTPGDGAGSPGRSTIGVFLALGVRLYRDGLELTLRASDGIEVVGTAPDLTGFSAAVGPDRPAPVLLLDVAAGDDLADLADLTRSVPDLRVVVLGVAENAAEIVRCAEAGAAGYVTREASIAELVATITSAAHWELSCPPQIAGALIHRVAVLAAERRPEPEAERLSRRELEIVTLIDRGLSNKQIAARLYISLATVKNHVHNILEKLGVQGRHEAAAWMRNQRRGGRRFALGQRSSPAGA